MRSLVLRWGLAIVIGTAWGNMFPSRATSAVPDVESGFLSVRR
jgi:hypothetical protein